MLHDTRIPHEVILLLAEEFAARSASHDRDGSFPFENFERLRSAGLLDLTVPRDFGGHGAGLTEACRVIGGIARGDASTALVLTMQLTLRGALLCGSEGLSSGESRAKRIDVEFGLQGKMLELGPHLQPLQFDNAA